MGRDLNTSSWLEDDSFSVQKVILVKIINIEVMHNIVKVGA